MSSDNNDIKSSEENMAPLARKHLIELIYLPIVAVLFFLFEFKIKSIISDHKFADRIGFAFIAFLIGILHLLSSNILSYMYNLQRIITPFLFPPIATSKRVKILGCIIVLASIVMFVFIDYS